MWILALDTSTPGGSAAVMRDGAIVAAAGGDPDRPPGERLPGDLVAIARTAGVALAAVDLFAVASGPGSFTGLRVGLATVQALALVHGRPVAPIPACDALAHAGGGGGDAVIAWIDGGRREVFAALYDGAGAARLDGPTVGAPAALLDAWAPRLAGRRVTVIGNGPAAAGPLIADRLGPDAVLTPAPPLAPAVAALAFARPGAAVRPHAAQPLYVRRPAAELARDRRAAAAAAPTAGPADGPGRHAAPGAAPEAASEAAPGTAAGNARDGAPGRPRGR